MTIDRDPQREYVQRLHARRKTVADYQLQDRRASVPRLLIAIAVVIVAFAGLWQHAFAAGWLLVTLLSFVALVVIHDRISRAQHRTYRAVEFYEDGIDPIED